jgi:hypothetical protein
MLLDTAMDVGDRIVGRFRRQQPRQGNCEAGPAPQQRDRGERDDGVGA